MILARRHLVAPTPYAIMVGALVYLNIMAILSLDVVRNVFYIRTVVEIMHVSGINALILARVLVPLMPFVR